MVRYDIKWLIIGLLIALVNPLIAGPIITVAYLTEPRLRREGWIVLGFSLVWAVVVLTLIPRL
jgi:hypothetical protein